uniref:Chitin-binding type-2 domain-containing protein n=1 Tax=Photinus pyralis TaxID=7054 RepID=A0A1Y1N3K2_PHOPY
MKIVILAFLSIAGFAVSQKTVSIAAPNCNFDISVKAPTSKCCCPLNGTDPTSPTTAPNGNKAGCREIITYESPTCNKAEPTKFPGRECISYYTCVAGWFGWVSSSHTPCPTGQMFSYVQQNCIKSPDGCCPI